MLHGQCWNVLRCPGARLESSPVPASHNVALAPAYVQWSISRSSCQPRGWIQAYISWKDSGTSDGKQSGGSNGVGGNGGGGNGHGIGWELLQSPAGNRGSLGCVCAPCVPAPRGRESCVPAAGRPCRDSAAFPGKSCLAPCYSSVSFSLAPQWMS